MPAQISESSPQHLTTWGMVRVVYSMVVRNVVECRMLDAEDS